MLKKALSILTVSTVVLLLGALGLSVALAQAPPTPSVTRAFSSPTVAPGDTVMVTIAFANVGYRTDHGDAARGVHLRVQQR